MKHLQITNKMGRYVDAHLSHSMEHQERGTATLAFYVAGCYMAMQMTHYELRALASMLNTAAEEIGGTA